MIPAGPEQAFVFGCEAERLIGILHPPGEGAPESTTTTTGVVVVVGGPQYRGGSHRQFVHMARALAMAGHPVWRFDARGMGDSTGVLRNFEHLSPDIGAAIDALLQHQPQVRQVVLWGLCDGASAALLYMHDRADPRVRGLCLLNPWVRSDASLARTHVKHYYTRRLRQREFWHKLLSGQVAGAALRGLVSNLQAARRAPGVAVNAPFQARMAAAWVALRGEVMLVLSGNDYTAKEFMEFTAADPVWREALLQPNVRRCELPRADHTCSDRASHRDMEAAILKWLTALGGGPSAADGSKLEKLNET